MTKLTITHIPVPKFTKVYLLKNSSLVFCGPLCYKSLQFKLNISLIKKFNSILLVDFSIKSNLIKTYRSIINELFKNIQNYYKKKLTLIGVGYRISLIKSIKNTFLELKLGYSHSIFIKVPKALTVVVPKPTKIYILGNDFLLVSQLSAFIKSLKAPDNYKGKGFRYDNDKLIIKEGKKI
jgi:ribosomal protein L6P/L9E